MSKIVAKYSVVGSAALTVEEYENVIDFPANKTAKHSSTKANLSTRKSIREQLAIRVMNNQHIQLLLNGSMQGYSVGKAKPWESALAITCFLVIAVASLYIG